MFTAKYCSVAILFQPAGEVVVLDSYSCAKLGGLAVLDQHCGTSATGFTEEQIDEVDFYVVQTVFDSSM